MRTILVYNANHAIRTSCPRRQRGAGVGVRLVGTAPPMMAPAPPAPVASRQTAIVVGVVSLHLLALWALQSGPPRRPVDVLVPVALLSVFVDLPAPKEIPPAPKTPEQRSQSVVKIKPPELPSPPQLTTIAAATPSLNAPESLETPRPSAEAWAAEPAPAPSPVAPSIAPLIATVPAPLRVDLPSTDADYLQNPRPVYPPLSKRLGEQGQVVYSVLIGADGLPISAKLIKSSGFERLDAAAYAAVMSWRYVPGKRNGVATQMSYNAPINWVLESSF